MNRSALLLRWIVAVAILAAGAPAFGSPGSTGFDDTAFAGEQPAAQSTDCNQHHATQREVAEHPAPHQCGDGGDCCMQHCTCQCAGLVLVIPLTFHTDAAIAPTSPFVSGGALLASIPLDALLRPPRA